MNPFWYQNGLLPKRFVYTRGAPAAPAGGGGGNQRPQNEEQVRGAGELRGDDLEMPKDEEEVSKVGDHIKFKHLKEDNLEEQDGQDGSREQLVKNLKALRDPEIDQAKVREMYGTRYSTILAQAVPFSQRVRDIRNEELCRFRRSVSVPTRREIDEILPGPSGNNYDAAINALSVPGFTTLDDKRTSEYLQSLNLVQVNQNTGAITPQQTSSAQEYLRVSDRIERLKSEIDSRKQSIERRKVALENHRNANTFLKETQKKAETNWRGILKGGVLTSAVLGTSSLAMASTWPLQMAWGAASFALGGGGAYLTWPAAGYMLAKKMFTDVPILAAREQVGNIGWGGRAIRAMTRWASGRISNEQDRAKARDEDLQYELEQEESNRQVVNIPGIPNAPAGQPTGYTVEELNTVLTQAEDELAQHRANCESTRKRLQEDKKHYEDKRDQIIQQGNNVPNEINQAIRGLETLIDLYSVIDPDKKKALDQTALGAAANNSTIVARLSNMPITNERFDQAIALGKREDDRQIKAQKEILELPYKENIFEEIHLLNGDQNNGEQGAVLKFLRTDDPLDFENLSVVTPDQNIARKAPTLYKFLRKINEENPRILQPGVAGRPVQTRTTKFRADMMLQMRGLMIDEIKTTERLRQRIIGLYSDISYTQVGSNERINLIKQYLNRNPAVVLNEAMRHLGSRPHKFKFTVQLNIPAVGAPDFDNRFIDTVNELTDRRELKLMHNLLEVIFRRFEIRESTGEIVLREAPAPAPAPTPTVAPAPAPATPGGGPAIAPPAPPVAPAPVTPAATPTVPPTASPATPTPATPAAPQNPNVQREKQRKRQEIVNLRRQINAAVGRNPVLEQRLNDSITRFRSDYNEEP